MQAKILVQRWVWWPEPLITTLEAEAGGCFLVQGQSDLWEIPYCREFTSEDCTDTGLSQ